VFRDLVARQDWDVCERAQRGVRSRFYEHGVYPRQERWIAAMNQRYREAMRAPVAGGNGNGRAAEGSAR
jgi:hypothetical protein